MKTTHPMHPTIPKAPTLRFSPYAWAKLLFLRDIGDTEVGGFGISSPGDLFLVEDIRLVRQRTTAVTVQFDDAAVADLFDAEVDRGRRPETFGRLWVHTHPGRSASPSGKDEATFARCFGSVNWAVMFILAKGGEVYARLRFNVGPGGELEIPVKTDFSVSFPASDHDAWEREYAACVEARELFLGQEQEPRHLLRDLAGADLRPALDEPDEFPMHEGIPDEFYW